VTRAERLKILGAAGVEAARLDGLADPAPTPEQLDRLRRIFATSGRKSPRQQAA
jgi:hypothetical protein